MNTAEHNNKRDRRPTAAVIGSGVAGLTAAHLLAQTHVVTLFESADRLGGHAHTHDVPNGHGDVVAIDSGFIVHNRRNYPNLVRLFDQLGVETRETEMSMSITCAGCGLSYAGGRGLSGLLAQPRRMVNPSYLRMLAEVRRFHRQAKILLADDSADQSWGDFLTAHRFSDYFIVHFATPLVACVWSSDDKDAMGYPARHLFEFLDNHGMLSVTGSPRWRTVVGGSRVYVEAVARRLVEAGGAVRTGTAVRSLSRDADGVTVTTDRVERFDHAVVATHADQALRLLADATPSEKGALARVRYSHNHAVLHDDDSFLPSAARARASWNHEVDCRSTRLHRPVRVNYWMNRLMGVRGDRQFVVSLNPPTPPASGHAIAEMEYDHPIFDAPAVAAGHELREAGGSRLAFAGAHLGWGFHEDGCRSGVAAAAKFGAQW